MWLVIVLVTVIYVLNINAMIIFLLNSKNNFEKNKRLDHHDLFLRFSIFNYSFIVS